MNKPPMKSSRKSAFRVMRGLQILQQRDADPEVIYGHDGDKIYLCLDVPWNPDVLDREALKHLGWHSPYPGAWMFYLSSEDDQGGT